MLHNNWVNHVANEALTKNELSIRLRSAVPCITRAFLGDSEYLGLNHGRYVANLAALRITLPMRRRGASLMCKLDCQAPAEHPFYAQARRCMRSLREEVRYMLGWAIT